MSESVPQEPGEPPYEVGPGKPPLHTRFGQPGANPSNPGGKPKGASILAPLLRKLAAEPNEHGEGKEAAALADQAILGARMGEDISGILKLLERTDGAVTKEQTVTLKDIREGIELHDRRAAK